MLCNFTGMKYHVCEKPSEVQHNEIFAQGNILDLQYTVLGLSSCMVFHL